MPLAPPLITTLPTAASPAAIPPAALSPYAVLLRVPTMPMGGTAGVFKFGKIPLPYNASGGENNCRSESGYPLSSGVKIQPSFSQRSAVRCIASSDLRHKQSSALPEMPARCNSKRPAAYTSSGEEKASSSFGTAELPCPTACWIHIQYGALLFTVSHHFPKNNARCHRGVERFGASRHRNGNALRTCPSGFGKQPAPLVADHTN